MKRKEKRKDEALSLLYYISLYIFIYTFSSLLYAVAPSLDISAL